MSKVNVSVIIPTYNEEKIIEKQLHHVLSLGFDEVILCDARSTDQTKVIVTSFDPVVFVEGNFYRASAMNEGARRAKGDILLFLHTDCTLSKNAKTLILEAMDDKKNVAGAFKTWTVMPDGQNVWWSFLFHLADFRSRYSSKPYGDQAMFVRKNSFNQVGGFKNLKIMEDYDLSQRLLSIGNICILSERVLVSARRMLKRPIYYLWMINLIPLLYRLGFSDQWLKKIYADPR